MKITFQRESAIDLRSLRFLVLWPHKNSIESCLLDVDFDASTQHYSLRNDQGEVVACCSLVADPASFENYTFQVRLRAMAVHPNFRRYGLGKRLLEEAFKAYSTDSCWCDAREVAVAFYQRCGWRIVSEPFDIPQIGKHFKMVFIKKGGN